MKPIPVVLIFCVMSGLLVGCVSEERSLYAEVTVTEGSPPVFRFGENGVLRPSVYISDITVLSEDPEDWRFFWAITTSERETRDSKVVYLKKPPIPLNEVVYGVVPDGFTELNEPLPLETNAEYRLLVFGPMGADPALVIFTYKPGKYSGGSPYATP